MRQLKQFIDRTQERRIVNVVTPRIAYGDDSGRRASEIDEDVLGQNIKHQIVHVGGCCAYTIKLRPCDDMGSYPTY